MKLLADGKLGREYEKALRFAFSQPLDAFVSRNEVDGGVNGKPGNS